MAEKRTITVVGSLVFDFVAVAERMPEQGETIRGNGFGMFTGGKGANQAVQAGRMGADCYLVGMIGDDFMGQAQKESLRKSNVKTDYLFTHPTARSGSCCIFVDARGENRIIIVPQANDEFHRGYLDRIAPLLAQSAIILLQLEIPLPTIEAVVALAKEENKQVILNPAPYCALNSDLLDKVDIITPSLTEAAALLNLRAQDATLAELADGLRALRRHGTSLITLGAKGALAITRESDVLVPAYPVQAVDETAAGDAFNGALAVAMLEGRSLIEAVKFANAAGAVAVTRRGAQASIGWRDEIEEFIARHAPLQETILHDAT